MMMMTVKLIDSNYVGIEIGADDWWELTKRLVKDATEMMMLVVLGIGEKIMQFMMPKIRENLQMSTKTNVQGLTHLRRNDMDKNVELFVFLF